MRAKYLWLDLETTGTIVNLDDILEVGLVATDSQLTVLDSDEIVIHHDGPEGAWSVTPEVVAMHTDNGLWDECRRFGMPVGLARARILDFIDNNFGEPPIAAGRSVAQLDFGFLKRDFPSVWEKFDRRVFDPTTLSYIQADLGRDKWKRPPGRAHRAVDDCLAAIAETRYYLDSWGLRSKYDDR